MFPTAGEELDAVLDFIGLKQTGIHEVLHRDQPVGGDGETTHVHPVLELADVEGGEGLGPAVFRGGLRRWGGGGRGGEWVNGKRVELRSTIYTGTHDEKRQHLSTTTKDVHVLEARLGQAAVQGGLPAFEALRDVDARSLLLPVHPPPGRLALA